MESRQIAVDGVTSVVHGAGNAALDEAVVFVHGNPGPSDDWHPFIPEVGEFARVVAPDMPGYGKADRPRDFDYTIQGYARHLDGLLQALNVRKVHLVLHDFGGAWGLQWAAYRPECVKSLALINVGALPGYRWHKFAKIWRTPLLGELFQLTTTRSILGAALNADNPRPFPPAFIDRLHGYSGWAQKRAVLKLYRATPDLAAFATGLADKLKGRRLPALVIWGEADAYLPVKYAEVQKEYFDAEVHRLPGCGHWPMIDEPQRFRELLIPFLRKQVTGVTA